MALPFPSTQAVEEMREAEILLCTVALTLALHGGISAHEDFMPSDVR